MLTSLWTWSNHVVLKIRPVEIDEAVQKHSSHQFIRGWGNRELALYLCDKGTVLPSLSINNWKAKLLWKGIGLSCDGTLSSAGRCWARHDVISTTAEKMGQYKTPFIPSAKKDSRGNMLWVTIGRHHAKDVWNNKPLYIGTVDKTSNLVIWSGNSDLTNYTQWHIFMFCSTKICVFLSLPLYLLLENLNAETFLLHKLTHIDSSLADCKHRVG